MRRLLLFVLMLSLFPSNLALASDELDTQNLADYFLFEEGTEWTYIASTGRDEETGMSTKEMLHFVATYCSEENCFAWDVDDEITDFELSDDGRTVSVDGNPFFSLDPFEATGGILSFDGTSLCSTEYIDAYEIQDFKRPTLKMTCTQSSTYTDYEGVEYSTFARLEFYAMKGVGLVKMVMQVEMGIIQIDADLVLHETSILHAGPFPDVPESSPNYEAISYLYEEGIIDGYEDGTFQGENSINRAELLKLLIEGQGVTPDEETYANCFTDVGTDWYAKYVCYAKEQGWVEGYEDGTFLPEATVNKVEALKMLLNSQGVIIETPNESPYSDVAVTDWFAPYVATAYELGLLEEDGTRFGPAGLKDREGVAENLYRLLLTVQVED